MPDWTRELRARLAPLAFHPEREAEIVEELSLHLDERYEELSASLPAHEARRLALADLDGEGVLARRLGVLRQSRAAVRQPVAAGAPRRRLLADLRQDARYAMRMLCLALLVAAGLFVRSLQRAQRIDPGFDVDRLVAMPLNVQLLRYTTAQGRAFYARAIEAAEALPGVEAASVARIDLLPGGGRTISVTVEGREAAPVSQSEGGAVTTSATQVAANVVGPRYFETLGLERRAGRDFTSEDGPDAPRVAIVNRRFADQQLAGVEPVGHRLSFRGPAGPWITIAGVVGDSTYSSIGETPTPVVYLPLSQNHETGMTLLVRAAGDPAVLVGLLREAIRRIEPNLPATTVRLAQDALAADLYPARMGALLLSGLGVLALLLAAIGLYGVLAFSTSRRTHEIGVRLALGADPRRVFALVVREGLGLVAVGAAIGLGIALAAAEVLESFLYGVSARDAATFAGVPVVLVLAALAACAIPARRAMRIDPTTALRSE